MDEFALIRKHFASLTPAADDVVLGIGDDAALIAPPSGHELVVTTDTLIAGRHFPVATDPSDIGWKSLAVNLSDLAAMGAKPRWFTLALTLPDENTAWLSGFAEGMGALACAQGITLVGGDTTRGPLSISITAMGTVPAGQALRRSGAQSGDVVCVTGTLGDAALALQALKEFSRDGYFEAIEPLVAPGRMVGIATAGNMLDSLTGATRVGAHDIQVAGTGDFTQLPAPRRLASVPPRSGRPRAGEHGFPFLYARLDRPTPRVLAGQMLRCFAHAAIDLSDGLAGDLGHVLESSGVGAEIYCEHLPMSAEFARLHSARDRLRLQAGSGDDYELCLCLPAAAVADAQVAMGELPLTAIGRIVAAPGLRWLDGRGRQIDGPLNGYRHF